MESKLKLAILDMYDGTKNLGMTNIQDIVKMFRSDLEYEIFDVRSAVRIPDLSHDIYIFSGGPGNPLMGDESWLKPFHDLIDDLWNYNRNEDGPKKFVFFICHSFQMACHHFKIGEIDRRRKKSFGTFPVHKTEAGEHEWLFSPLNEPFWVADFREFQIIQPDFSRMGELGIKLLCIEKDRPHLELERAMMAVRFSPEMIGTQFHPEADPVGMREYFAEPERLAAIFEEYGEEKYRDMVAHLHDPDKIARTHATILPLFLNDAIRRVRVGALELV
jgi:homoserine O-succinyltransferase/O-acetyltransferase